MIASETVVFRNLKSGGMEMGFREYLGIRSDEGFWKRVDEIRRVLARRASKPSLHDAARAYPRVMQIFEEMKKMTPHTVLAAAARRYCAQVH